MASRTIKFGVDPADKPVRNLVVRGHAVYAKVNWEDDWELQQGVSCSRQDDDGEIVGKKNREGVAQLVLARQFFPELADDDQTFSDLSKLMSAGQADDGTWKPGGQLPGQKRAANETSDVSMMWLALALSEFSDADGREAKENSNSVKAFGRDHPQVCA